MNQPAPHPPFRVPVVRWSSYVGAVAAVAACTGADALMYPQLHPANLAMVYMLGVVGAAYGLGRGPALLTSVLSALAFDFFFTPPRFSLTMEDAQDVFTCGVMLLVSLAISHLTVLARAQAELADQRAKRTAALFALSRDLAVARGEARLLGIALRHVTGEFRCSTVALTPDEFGLLQLLAAAGADARMPPGEGTAAELAFHSAQIVPGGPGSPLDAAVLYVPLVASAKAVGVLRVDRGGTQAAWTPDQVRLLEAFAQLTALAVAGDRGGETASA